MDSQTADIRALVDEIRVLVHAGAEAEYAELHNKLKEIADDMEKRYGTAV